MLNYLKYIARIIGIKAVYIKILNLVLKGQGFELLGESETHKFLSGYKISTSPKNKVLLPEVKNSNGHKVVFKKKYAVSNPVYVWDYHETGEKVRLSRYGSVMAEHKVWCTDRDHWGFYRGLRRKDNRPKIQTSVLIAPFSHDQDDIMFGGYYDFVFLVAAKLCRIKDAITPSEFKKAIVAYPLFKGAYELEYLALLDIKVNHLIDTRNTEVIADKVISGNFANAFYPHKADILSLRRYVMAKLPFIKTGTDRIYICRANRRRVSNEGELIELLKTYNFKIIEDAPRSVAEQVRIYHNASFIMGPHGASFSNLIWCEPGTHLFELFSPNYVPDFFLYLAKVMDMEYSAFHYGTPTKNVLTNEGLTDDMFIHIPTLDNCLKELFKD